MGQVCPAVATQLGRPTENGPSSLSNGTTASAPPQKTGDEKLLDKYTLGKVLGQGAFGVVYACKSKATREEFAVKMIDQVETPVSEIKQEVDMLRKLAHPCVVKLHDVYYEKVFVCMVLEIYKGGDMIEGMQLHWKSKGMIPVPVVQNMSKMMFQGIDWLHSKDVIHRDLKGDNYLQDRKDLEHPSCRVYLSDFGTVMNLGPNDRLRQKCGTKTYWAPEFYALNYGIKVDIWALGVILYELVCGYLPFGDNCESTGDVCKEVLTGNLQFPSDLEGITRELIEGLLVPKPHLRLGCNTQGYEEIKKKPFFSLDGLVVDGLDNEDKSLKGADFFSLLIGRELQAPIPPTLQEPTKSGHAEDDTDYWNLDGYQPVPLPH
mmetsp:Transcript_80119/g.166658  ORF Transcript_80119/g.166658 Transcript_80119/m.166658 type:complete len:376 (+) Transcript_80119:93-1220(+)